MKTYKILLLFFLSVQISFSESSIFTKEQQQYLNSKKNIKMCVDPSWEPFEYIEDNKHKGLIADIFKEFKKQLPLSIDLVQSDTWEETLAYIKSGKCEVLAAAAKTNDRTKYLKFTNPFLKFPQVIATKVDEKFIEDFNDIVEKKIGIVKNSAIAELIKEKYPKINLVDVKNVDEGLYKVSNGELFGFVNTSAAIGYALAKMGMTKNLKIASKVGIEYYIRTAIKNENFELLEIFNTLIKNLDKAKLNEIKNKWLYVRVEKDINYEKVYQVLFICILIILLILYWNSKLKKEINERKKAQNELNKFVQVIEQSPISVIITDLEGKIEYINPFALEKTGYKREELIGQNPRILKSETQSNAFYEELWNSIIAGSTWHGNFQNKKKNGELFWESAIITPIFNKKGEIEYYGAIKDDISKKLEEKAELKKAKKDADEANKAKSDFLAKMSHEIRTPMNAVLGMLYLLEETKTSDTQKGYIKKAKNAAKSLLGLINDILDFSKIEAGKFDIQMSEFHFNDMITGVLSVTSVKAEEKGIELLANFDSKIPEFIQSDELRVEQILTNLLSNAVKFTKEGEVILSIKLKEQNQNSMIIQFYVKDTGIGISKADLPKLFEEFSQIDNSQTRTYEGTGLGLAISKKLANLLGGDIWCEYTKEDVGSTFCFTIKCNVPKNKIFVEDRYAAVQKIEDLKCLIVDDNPSAIEVLEKMLLSLGYSVVSCTNGEDAIRIVNEKTLDMIFLDYKMEGLNGVETFNLIKSIVKVNDIKVIMVTAFTKDILSEDIELLDIDGYLSKPISPSSLYDKIIDVYYKKLKPKLNKKIQNTKNYFKGVKVLLAEDNTLNTEFAIEILSAWNIKVDVAVDGAQALAKINSKEYDAVLMDIQMPNMDGLEATKYIRNMEDQYFKKIPIIAISANALVGDREKSLEAGMQEHITKPLNPNILFETLQFYLKDKVDSRDIPLEVDLQEEYFLENLDSNIFDLEEAMLRINDNKKVYIKILKQFSEKYKNFYSELIQILNSDDLEKAHLKVHEIKGIAANISANTLFDTLRIIDIKLKSKIKPQKELLEKLKDQLEKTFNNIEQINIDDSLTLTFDKKIVMKLLDEIRDNLETDIVKVESKLEYLIPYLKEDFHTFGKKLTSALDEFDTNKAKILIENFKKDMQDG